MKETTPKNNLSSSDLWQRLGTFYQNQGIAAWNNQIPYYITSNPYIANAYAQVITRFIQDLNTLTPSAKEEPVYILELGSGTGIFSF